MNTPAKKPRLRRILPWAATAALVALVVVGLLPSPVKVETARVRRGPLAATVSEEGKTRIRQRHVVSAPVSGRLRRIPHKPGAALVAGETLLAVIDPLPASPLDERSHAVATARRDAAAALVARCREALDLARSELRRCERLLAAMSGSQQDLEFAKARETAASLELASAEGALAQSEAEIAASRAPSREPVEIRSHLTGQVLQVFQESERAVAQGTPLMEIGDAADLEVVVEMLSRDGASLQPGARVEIEQWGGPKPLPGRVRLVEPAAFTKISALGVEEQRVYVVVELMGPQEERRSLGDKYRVEARVFVWEQPDELQAPTAALFRHKGDWAAFVVRGGRAVLTPVKAGRGNGIYLQVLSGLSEGEELVLYPGERVSNGSRVRVIRVGTAE